MALGFNPCLFLQSKVLALARCCRLESGLNGLCLPDQESPGVVDRLLLRVASTFPSSDLSEVTASRSSVSQVLRRRLKHRIPIWQHV